MNIDFVNVTRVFQTNTDLFSKILCQLPADLWLVQPTDNSNHPLWIAGHITVTRGNALSILGGTWDTPWKTLFDRGAPLRSPAAYPSIGEIQQCWEKITPQLMGVLEALTVDAAARPGVKGIPSFDEKMTGMIAFLGYHETYHVGQLAYLTKWAGGGQITG